MRTLATFAITLGTAAFLATSASAVSSLNVTYTGGSTAGAAVGNTVAANVSDILSFDVSVTVDAAGILGLGFDVQYDDPTSLNSATWQAGSFFVSFAPLQQATYSTPTPGATTPGGEGRIRNLGWTSPFTQAPTNTTVFMGTVTFHVTDTNPNGIFVGFFATDGSSATDGPGSMFITPNFSSFTINPVPEPGLAALMGLGLAGLALAGRRTKK